MQAPAYANWVRSRACELENRGEIYSVVLLVGGRCITADEPPQREPEFAIKRADGTIERSPWAE